MPNIQNLLRYWRHCLADGELSAPRWQDNPDKRSIGLDELLAGQVNSRVASGLVDKVERRMNRNRPRPTVAKRSDGYITIDQIDIAIAPFCVRRRVEHGQSRHQDSRFHAPFWISAQLDRAGALSPHPGRAAWFVREYLDPTGRDDTIVGELSAMDTFLAGSPRPELAGNDSTASDATVEWPAVIAWVESFFGEVTGGSPWSFRLDDHETILEPRILPHKPMTGASQHLLWLYDTFLALPADDGQNETPPPLMASLAREAETLEIDPGLPLDDAVRRRHLGQMTDRFGLGPSQRESLHALFQLARGESMALNGPPGTGKTAWIQSVVASLWVERALEQGLPPIIVATSANNRAVTNILDTFQNATPGDATGLAERWLPIIDTYGLFLPSEGQSKATTHRCAMPGRQWSGLPREIENRATLDESETHYLDLAGAHYSTAFSKVETVVEHLHGHLRATATQVTAILESGERLRQLRETLTAPSPEIARERLVPIERAAEEAAAQVEALAREIDDAVAIVPLLDELLAFLPPIRERRNHRFVRLFRRYELPAPDLARWSYRQDLESAIEDHRRVAALRIAEIEERRRAIDEWEERERDWAARIEALVEPIRSEDWSDAARGYEAATDDPRAVEPLLDRTLRRQLFLLAGRYWEGRWLLDLRALLDDNDTEKLHRQSRADCLRRFRRFAMLTPLLVSTVYMLPKSFDFYSRGRHPLVEGIDLLIVEEAGQVAPELGGVLFSLAQRAVVLGDIFQIEPVWNVGHAIDDANRERHGATSFDQEVFHSSRGSLMGVARARTRRTTRGRTDGLWLREHRRCVPDVIAYCRELVPAYRHVLEAHRPELADRELPALGWAHVRSEAEQTGGSWRNPGQAEAIARWLGGRRSSLEALYERPLHEIVGIVTPFRSQAKSLRNALALVGFGSDLEVGTIHTFQGGELPVMLFSPVAARDQGRTPFFDKTINMLNVAVSRAQDSFLVFGDMKIFDPASSKPSGILARHLFAEESNELPDVDQVPELLSLPEVERIAGLEAHRRVLREAFEQARERLLIVSPYLTRPAIEAEDLVDRIATTRARVSIAYSTDMANDKAPRVAERLREAGAEVISLRGFHTKTLAIDDTWFTHGSFNWLSAVRQPGAQYQHFEASIRCGPPTAPNAISEIWSEIDACRASRRS